VARDLQSQPDMKVAFATADLERVDAHFGWCPHLTIWEIGADGARAVARHDFSAGREDGDEDKLAPRVAALEGCAIVYAAAIGGSAVGRVKARRVHAARVAEGEPIAALVDRLRALLAGTPPPWLRRLIEGRPAFDPTEVKPCP
jgi:nitrogen fixation protein NifX